MAFSGIHTEHRILQVGFMLLWKDQYENDFYYRYYQNPVHVLKQKMRILCHKPSSRSLDSLIHEVLQFSYFSHFPADITAGFLLLLTFFAVDLPRSLNNFCYVRNYWSHWNQKLLFYYFLMHSFVVTNILFYTSKFNNSHEWNQNVWAFSLHRHLWHQSALIWNINVGNSDPFN